MATFSLRGIVGFEWDKGNISHIAKHNVAPRESEDVFFDKNNVLDEDLKHSVGEQRFLIIGKTKRGRILYQIFTVRGGKIRVVSSRDINKKEVSLYEKKVDNSKI
ncbi:MAG: BrnT family toxin [Candidatus Blackburnbacteria bacterium]|nr:BrnT family toxin [Candidatus Blackburnbacteria bacterium]